MFRTLVELYDKQPIENVIGACCFEPELVVYICDKRDSSLRREMAVVRLLASRGLQTRARFLYVDTADTAEINRALTAVVRDYPNCAFDCTGGSDLVLLCAGLFCRDNNIDAFYIDIDRGKLVSVFGCERLQPQFVMPKLTLHDIFAMQDAAVIGSGHFDTPLPEEFEATVYAVWEVLQHNPEAWGGFVGWLQAAGRGAAPEQLTVSAPKTISVNKQIRAYANEPILHKLAALGLLQNLRSDGSRISFCYASPLLKNCLTNHGIWLELLGYYAAKASGLFHEVHTSVVVDWNADKRGAAINGYTTRNEIDVLLIRGVTPVFISCKMGVPSPLALSEIKILSEKFGGSRTKTVLMTGAKIKGVDIPITQRARDLHITIIDRPDLSRKGLASWLKRLADTMGSAE